MNKQVVITESVFVTIIYCQYDLVSFSPILYISIEDCESNVSTNDRFRRALIISNIAQVVFKTKPCGKIVYKLQQSANIGTGYQLDNTVFVLLII